jgi:AcrR family transcriptional regulator
VSEREAAGHGPPPLSNGYSADVQEPAPPTTGRAPRRRPKDRKQQIILQARDLFVDRGFPNVPMALIAERVGITAGALYRHFDNKQVLLEEVIRESFGYLDDVVTSESLEPALDEAIEKLLGHPYLADLWTNEVRHLPEGPRTELRRRFRDWTRSFEPALRGERPDLDPGQEELMAWALQSTLSFLGSSATRTPPMARRPAVRAAALALAHAPLEPSGPPSPQHVPRFVPASTRERLLISAIEQFAERGYSETAMSAIGAAVDVTGPNLYGYFGSKAELLKAVSERGMHALWLNLDEALRSADTAEDALSRLIAGHARLASSWTQSRIDLVMEAEFAESARAAQREYVGEWVALVRVIVPDMEVREARLRSLIALKVLNDLNRTPHLASLVTFPANVTSLATAIVVGATDASPIAASAARSSLRS